jgi:hypothetical protein
MKFIIKLYQRIRDRLDGVVYHEGTIPSGSSKKKRKAK